jgi:uncharacterized integral membrane protein (TIGR00697 family)
LNARSYRWLPAIAALFVTSLIVSNIVAVKLIRVGPFTLTGALLIFSVSYIFGDVLTEVYGYARARQVIWIGFACNLLAVLAFYSAGILPPAPEWTLPGFDTPADAQSAYNAILGFTPLILLASFVAYLAGEFLNSYVLARMKLITRGRWLWSRTIASTFLAQIVDTGLFLGIIWAGGLLPGAALAAVFAGEWLSKVLYEVAATPVTYQIINYLKRVEQVDYFDRTTDFNPLRVTE